LESATGTQLPGKQEFRLIFNYNVVFLPEVTGVYPMLDVSNLNP